MITTILVVFTALMLLAAAFPTGRHSWRWGYFPSGGLGLVVVLILVILLLAGR